MMETPKSALVQQHIGPNPYRPGAGDVRIKGAGISVWAIIAYWQASGRDAARTARAYELPNEAVEAALDYYREHQAAIDARLEANDAAGA
ncbi:MAG: DUF433 domain-containing protein [Chloroflexi bacterium]|nr:DUF433 domain-containing protein [Chloroflexota bacterium]